MTVNKVILGSHNHLPLSTTEESLEVAYNAVYKPFISALYRFPVIPMVLHYSGILLAWFERRHPEFLMILDELVNRKQVEILGGGYYEPLFLLIPLSDRIGQIEMMTTFIRKQFGKRPRGCWIPGFAWEQSLTGALHTAGMDYVFLGSDQFVSAGLDPVEALRPCLTEDQGKIITVFPVSRSLSEINGFNQPLDLIAALQQVASNRSDNVAIVFPSIYDPLPIDIQQMEIKYEDFFKQMAESSTAETFTLPSRLLKRERAYRKVYFPSSAERAFTSSDGKAAADGHRNGETTATPSKRYTPRSSLLRFPEANGLYARMLYTHLLINQLRGDKYRKRTSREELWKAQGIDAYWRRNRGGIYDNGLRKAYYRAMIQAEKMTREKGVFLPSIIAVDFDFDGEKDYLIQGVDLNCFVKARGASVFELDCLPKNWNYLDTFAAESELSDSIKTCAFVDRFLETDLQLADAVHNSLGTSRYCGNDWYEELELDRLHQELVLKRSPSDDAGPFKGLEIIKKISIKKNCVSVRYAILNRGDHLEHFVFCPEINLSLANDSSEFQTIRLARSTKLKTIALEPSEWRNIEELVLFDEANQIPIKLQTSLPFDLWIIPHKAGFPSSDGNVACYQHTGLWPLHSVVLAPGDTWGNIYTLRFGR